MLYKAREHPKSDDNITVVSKVSVALEVYCHRVAL
jgi:hypothetical protein